MNKRSIKTIGLLTNSRNLHFELEIKLTMGPETLLGIPVGKNIDRGEYWEGAIEKLRKKIAPWRLRDLSYMGKVHILKSIGISVLLYGAEMTQMEDKYINEVKGIIWDFIWGRKTCYVNEEICRLPRDMGGINMPDFEAIVKARRIKMLVNLLKSNEGGWSILPLDYFKCLDRKYNLQYFALRVNDSLKDIRDSNVPMYYKDCLLAFQEMCRLSRKIMEDENHILWCNNMFKYRGESLRYSHWAKSGLIWLSDVILDGHIHEDIIKHKVQRKAGIIFEIATIKKCISSCCYTKSYLQNYYQNVTEILNMVFEVPTVGYKKLSELTSADIYKIFTISINSNIKSENYWANKFPQQELNFDDWYKYNFKNKLCPRKCLDFNWRIFLGQINTEKKLRHMSYSNGQCKLCKTSEENFEHLLIGCCKTNGIWYFVQSLFANIGIEWETNKFEIISGIQNDNIDSDIMNMILSISRWIIWKRRCLNKYDDKFIGINELKKWIKSEVKHHIHDLLKCEFICKNPARHKKLESSLVLI